jgi:phosphatidylglycerophosphate synthase
VEELGSWDLRLWIDAAADSGEVLFGMSLVERHIRAAAKLGGLTSVCVDAGAGKTPSLPAELVRKLKIEFRSHPGPASERLSAYLHAGSDSVIVVSGDTVVDLRLFEFALGRPAGFAASGNGLWMMSLDPKVLDRELPAAATVGDVAQALVATGKVPQLEQSDFPPFIRHLRRDLPFYLLPVRDRAEREAAERFMFRANYKGSTDFFTRYVYPFMVWRLVRPLARMRVHPNWVSAFNIVLGLGAVPAFAMGEYVLGFVCAYAMSILDSVDGKLARLTFTDSKLGTRLDHGLDLIHPPLWYLAWAWAVARGDLGDPVIAAAVLLVIVYILDRLCVKVYTINFHRALYAHSRLDGFVRTFIARRNINLPLFMIGVILGYAREAFLLIVAWQVITLVWHTCRIAWILMFDADKKNSAANNPAV